MAGPSTRPKRRAQGRSERAGTAAPAHTKELEVIDEVASIVSSSLRIEDMYDMIFTDLGMPGLTGWDVARAIKRHRRDVPVIMVTGWGVGIDQSQVDRNGVDEVLSKPFAMDKLLNLVHRLMGEKR